MWQATTARLVEDRVRAPVRAQPVLQAEAALVASTAAKKRGATLAEISLMVRVTRKREAPQGLLLLQGRAAPSAVRPRVQLAWPALVAVGVGFPPATGCQGRSPTAVPSTRTSAASQSLAASRPINTFARVVARHPFPGATRSLVPTGCPTPAALSSAAFEMRHRIRTARPTSTAPPCTSAVALT